MKTTLLRCFFLCSLSLPVPAAVRHVPATYPTVRAAYAAAQDGDIIEMTDGLYLEAPGEFLPEKRVTFRPAATHVEIATTTNAPANDRVANALPIFSSSVTVQGENYSAMDVTGEPTIFGLPPTNSVWYVWTAPFSGEAVATAASGEFIPRVGVATWRDGSLEPFPETYPYRQPYEVAFNAQEGGTYYLAVDTFDGRRGSFQLTLKLHPPPANDQFAQAVPLAGRAATALATNVGAIAEPGEPVHAGTGASHSLWWTWTAPTNPAGPIRSVRLSTASSDFDTVLAVYTGNFVNALTLVTANDDALGGGRHSEVSFTPVSGQTYRVAVDGSTAAGPRHELDYGHIVLSLDYSAVELRAMVLSSQLMNRETDFRAEARIHNRGNAPTGPLRLRVVAQGARSPYALRAYPETPGLVLFLSGTIAGVPPGQEGLVPFAGLCPAPVDGDALTPPRLWAVFAQIEELFGSAWLSVDGAFVLFGDTPRQSGFVVDPGPLRSLDGTLVNPRLVDVLAFQVESPATMRSGQSAQARAIAQLTTGNEIIQPYWESLTLPLLSLNTDGLLHAAQACSAISSFRAGFSFAAEQWWATNRVTILPPDAPAALRALLSPRRIGPGTLQILLNGKPCRDYRLERRTELGGAGVWIPVVTNTAGVDGALFFDALPMTNRQAFYRTVELP